MYYVNTKEHTISIRVPSEIFAKLKQSALANYTSASEIARDVLLSALITPTDEHEFLSRTQWAKAIKSRDGYCCVDCGSGQTIDAHHIIPVYQGGRNVLSNGKTLCRICHSKTHNGDTYIKEDDHIPAKWRKLFRNVQYTRGIDEETFWKEQLALYCTKRKNRHSSVVEKYIQDYLKDFDLETVRDTVLSLCPSPDIVKDFPSRSGATKTPETFLYPL